MSKEAMKQWLEAFKKIKACRVNVWDVDEEIKSLEEALAKQEQGEPTKCCNHNCNEGRNCPLRKTYD